MNVDEEQMPTQIQSHPKRDSSLLILDKRLEGSQGLNPILNKFILKPQITKIEKSKFLDNDKIQFLEMFKRSTQEMLGSQEKQAQFNIEAKSGPTSNEEKFVKMNLKLGILDIVPNENQSVTTMNTLSDVTDRNNFGAVNLTIDNLLRSTENSENDRILEALNNDHLLNLLEDEQSDPESDSNCQSKKKRTRKGKKIHKKHQ